MVHMRVLAIDLAKNRRLVRGGPGSAVNCDFRIEGELRAGKHAYRGTGIVRSSEPAGAGAEIARSKLVANACGTRFDVHQAIVAHGRDSSVPHLFRLTRGPAHCSLHGSLRWMFNPMESRYVGPPTHVLELKGRQT